MEDDEIIIENDEEVLEQDELQDEEDTIDLDNIIDDESEEEIEETEEDEEEVEQDDDVDEIDYKALYEEEQKKRRDLQSALNSERKQRKQSTKKSDITSTSTYKDLVAKGVDSDVAEAIAKSVEKRSEETTSQIADLKFEAAIAKASKKFDDIEEYAEDIRPFVDKGLTIEQAYYVATGEKNRTNTKAEIKRQIEAKIKNQKTKSKIQKIDTTGGSGNIKSKEKFSAMDIKMAKAFGMSPKEYADYKNINSEKDYQKMKSKNK